MANKNMKVRIRQYTNTSTSLKSSNPIIPSGLIVFETDTGMYKIGKGTNYNSTSYGQIEPPVGTTMEFASYNIPIGWLKEDGSAVSRTTYAALFAVIGTTYGAGNGSTTFNLPNTQGYADYCNFTDSNIGVRNANQTHNHGAGSWAANAGAVNDSPGTIGYHAVGRDPNIGFNRGVYTYWYEGDEGNVGISRVNHSSQTVGTTNSSDTRPYSYWCTKAIKY